MGPEGASIMAGRYSSRRPGQGVEGLHLVTQEAERVNSKYSKTMNPQSPFPPARLYLLKAPHPPQTALPTRIKRPNTQAFGDTSQSTSIGAMWSLQEKGLTGEGFSPIAPPPAGAARSWGGPLRGHPLLTIAHLLP